MADVTAWSLATGQKLPAIGLGTWKAPPGEVGNAVEIAVRAGYRHLDLAMIYDNQEEIGHALKRVIPSVVKREELFITSKVWCTSYREGRVAKELDKTLEQLQLDYVDLYLVHWPVAFEPQEPGVNMRPGQPGRPEWVIIDPEPSLCSVWKQMIALPKSKVRAIGVSNFTVEHIKGIVEETGVWPVANQVEAHPLLPQEDLYDFCKEHNIHITGYSPLGNNQQKKPLLTEHPVVKEVAQKIGATPAQVLIAWGIYRGTSVVPKSVHKERIIENLKEVKLSKEDFEKVSSIKGPGHTRYNIPSTYPSYFDVNVFNEEVEQNLTYKVKIK